VELLLGEDTQMTMKSHYTKGAANLSESTSLHKVVVPSGMVWEFFGGYTNRDNSVTQSITIKDPSDQAVHYLSARTAGTGVIIISNAADYNRAEGTVKIGAGYYIEFSFGGACGANAICAFMYEEVPA
jgi:outer membrane receptor for monomeric catechols